jgi:hypothetical protein
MQGRKGIGSSLKMKEKSQGSSNLSGFPFNPIKNGLESGRAEAAGHAGGLISFISFAQSLRAKVKGVSEWLVDALERFPAGHKDLY